MFKKLKSHLYALQLLEYEPRLFISWLSKNPGFYPPEVKGKLGWSAKAKALYTVSLLLQLIIALIFSIFFYFFLPSTAKLIFSLLVFFTIFSLINEIPFSTLLLSLLVLTPFESLQRRFYVLKAKQKIKLCKNLKVIAVTGSFGKTSVKDILAQILPLRFKTVFTPESHNKILSITQTIEANLKPDSQVFVVEMGAYRRGEIAEICQLTKPQIGIITGITAQHLVRFETLENIKKAKYELIESLPKDGFAVFNLDNEGAKELFEKCHLTKAGYSIKDVKIETSSEMTSFELFDQKVGTTLLGTHNIANILAAVEVAKFLGLTVEEIVKGIKSLHPVPHRLELIRGSASSIIIDDAYSSNIEGYRAAFNLVNNLKNYPKILVTPGLIELAGRQFDENVKMAKEASLVFDYAVIVNQENREALVGGFLSQGWTLFDPVREKEESRWTLPHRGIEKDKLVYTADSLNEVTRNIFPKLTKPTSLILLENDLPDIYR